MKHDVMAIGAMTILLCFPFVCTSSTIPDDPVTAIEPELEIDDRLGGVIGWVDEHTLLATALIGRMSQFWEKKVVSVDARTGKTQELLNPGALICVNPTEKIAGIMVGSAENLYTVNSKQANPEIKLYSWSAGVLTPKVSDDNWNFFICRKTKPADVKEPSIGFQRRKIRYLEEKDGYLAFSINQSSRESNVSLIRAEKSVAVVEAKPNEIAPVPQYLPFRKGYLLSPGRFVMNTKIVPSKNATTSESPVVMMTIQGMVNRNYCMPLFTGYGEINGHGETFPCAKGTLIFVENRPQDGGGIYLNQGSSLKRVWCTNNGNEYDRRCRATSISVSPDGCYVAFYSKGSDNLKAPFMGNAALKILHICK